MALDKVLKVYDDNGNEIDYDILAKDVKFLPDGKDLPTKLAELEDEIGQGGYAPPQGGIPKTDLAQSVQDSLDKADSALQDEDVAEVAKTGDYNDLENKPTIPDTSNLATKTELQQGLGAKQDALVAGNGIVIGNDGKTVSVDAEVVQPVTADGTFTIRIGNNEYTVNLNHEHEGMAKLVVDTAANLPDASEMESDTIYGEVDDGEISVLYVGGYPFYGGGGGGVSTPVLRQPADESTIEVGTIESGQSSVTKTITVKGKNLTQALTVAVTGTGYSANKQTISAADANVGTTLTITCTNTAEDAAGTLSIASSEVSCDCDMIANKATYESLTAVKLNGTQWMKTDYYVNANSKVSMRLKFTENSHSPVGSVSDKYFLTCKGKNTSGNYNYAFYCYISQEGNELIGLTTTPVISVLCPNLFKDNSVLDIYGTTMKFTPGDGSSAVTGTLQQAIASMPDPLHIGYYIMPTDQSVKIFNVFDLTIYELTISENDVVKRHYVPKTRNGIPGLYDTVTGTFISSETSTELVAVN